MKKVLLAASLLAGFAASAHAASGIVGTKHDLSSGITSATSIHASNQNQTCVFCHAPHNAVTNKLLWNRTAISGSSFKVYTSYNTAAMRTTLPQNTLTDDSSSLLCLSCHSLGTAANVITNTQNVPGITAAAYTGTSFPTKTGNMTDLTNDHPVGISYGAAQTQAGATSLKTAASITPLRLFKSSVGNDIMECASCHAVHGQDNGAGGIFPKFLAVSNANSALCTTCHVK